MSVVASSFPVPIFSGNIENAVRSLKIELLIKRMLVVASPKNSVHVLVQIDVK